MGLCDLTVVLVVFNSKHCIQALVPFLKELPNLIIVDNASSDLSVEFIRQKVPNAKLIINGVNLGFGAANNQAICVAQTPYVFLLNPDCEIAVETLFSFIKYAKIFPNAAILAPQLLRSDGKKDLSYRWPKSYWGSRGVAADGPACVGFASGAALFLNLKNSKNLFFDESYFLYYEDDDLCQRVFEEKTQIIVIPEIKITHRLGGSVRYKKPFVANYYGGYYLTESHLKYVCKYIGKGEVRRLRIKYILISVVQIIFFVITLNFSKAVRFFGRLSAAAKTII
jgi:N-acetylglucosaminyl-diphospho-decaprenol L-rhamnosyltransferase